ncbi:hypothetical protein F5879DRAFT_986906 [Lentinula edodes]|nr:hypothetical protein F5879DRAFT_986906 [Lentinula edodes]
MPSSQTESRTTFSAPSTHHQSAILDTSRGPGDSLLDPIYISDSENEHPREVTYIDSDSEDEHPREVTYISSDSEDEDGRRSQAAAEAVGAHQKVSRPASKKLRW